MSLRTVDSHDRTKYSGGQKQVLDGSGCFLFGKYSGDLAEDICRQDPGYVRWLLDKIENMDDDDRSILEAHLLRRSRR